MRELFFAALRFSGIPWLLRTIFQRRAVTILCYHDMAPEVAERHFAVLNRIYIFISLRDYIDWRMGRVKRAPPPNSIVVTLDDGHRGNTKLYPVFEKYRLTPTIFLCSAIVGTNRHFWWTSASDSTEEEFLKTLTDESRRAMLIRRGFDEQQEQAERQALSSAEIRFMRGVADFQSHTRFHRILTKCDAAVALAEMEGSKKELEEEYGLSVWALAFPNGDFGDREMQLARSAGYECALTLEGGYNTRRSDLFRLKRIRLSDDAEVNELIVKASGMWDIVQRCFGRRTYGYRS